MPPSPGDAAPVRQPPSAAARYFFVFLLGLTAGVVLVVMLSRALQARRGWQDHYPRAAMRLMEAHVAQLRASAAADRCTATGALPHLRSLRSLAEDLEPAFPDLGDDTRFVDHAGGMRATLDDAIASPPADCPAWTATMQALGDGCRACHRDFRG